jgi:hydrogenase maturation factor
MSDREHQKATYRASSSRECEAPTADGQCITCSDMALPATVLRIDQDSGLAVAAVKETTEEIDISLVNAVVPGDVVLVHGGVAIALLDEASDE